MSRPVAVVGTGTIGASWAALFLARGHDVRAHDPAPGAEARLRNAVADAWPALSRLGLAADADRARLSFHADLPATVQDAAFVQESGPEDADTKTDLLSRLDAGTPADAVIASSSSGLMPSTLQEMCAHHPERVLVGHPFHPAALVPLVEVVPGAASTERAVQSAVAFYADLGKRPIVVRREVPGHVTNRLQAALWREAYSLVERGVATVADIDAAISNGPGLRWALLGPLVGQHLSGGPGGMAQTLRHLGPPAQAWMDDLGAPRLTDDLTDLLVRGVDDELAGIDQQAMATARDDLLVDLLTRKRASPDLP
jgi:3-hydroxyacyl-CoA dehydrogenase